ncbi:hypothetical protein LSAT2_002688, partial [Lamellibrachia satsuma]
KTSMSITSARGCLCWSRDGPNSDISVHPLG